jgi:hypothetical protein
MYVQEYRFNPTDFGLLMDTGDDTESTMWPDEIEPYVRRQWTNALYKCPAYSGPMPVNGAGFQ